MKKFDMLAVTLALFFVTLLPISVRAGEREGWYGKDSNGYFHAITKGWGRKWEYRDSSFPRGVLPCTEVSRTADYIELLIDDIPENKGGRLRLYKDKLVCRDKQLRSGWLELAKGKWAD